MYCVSLLWVLIRVILLLGLLLLITIVQLDSVKSKMQQPKESLYEVIELSVRN